MTKEQVAQIKTDWETFNGPGNAGRLAVLTADLKYTSLTMNATDAQLIDQLKWTGENVCNAYHVPPFMVGIGEIPRGVQVEAMLQMYYSQCIQSLDHEFRSGARRRARARGANRREAIRDRVRYRRPDLDGHGDENESGRGRDRGGRHVARRSPRAVLRTWPGRRRGHAVHATTNVFASGAGKAGR